MALVGVLVAFGIVYGRGAQYQVEADLHYPNEFCILIGPSAKGRKGSSWGTSVVRSARRTSRSSSGV